MLLNLKKQILVAGLLLLPMHLAWATNVGGTADRIYGYFGTIGDSIISFFLLVGLIFVGLGLLKIKEHRDNPGNVVTLRVALAYLISGGLLAVVLGVMTIAPDSITDGNGDTTPGHQRITISDAPSTSSKE